MPEVSIFLIYKMRVSDDISISPGMFLEAFYTVCSSTSTHFHLHKNESSGEIYLQAVSVAQIYLVNIQKEYLLVSTFKNSFPTKLFSEQRRKKIFNQQHTYVCPRVRLFKLGLL